MSDEARRNELTLDLKKRGRGGESVRELEDWTDGKKEDKAYLRPLVDFVTLLFEIVTPLTILPDLQKKR
jgi:hypothetical protein